MSFFENTRKPVGLGGKIMVAMMNLGHSAVARWGLQFLELAPDARVLDCGCGGGANMKRLLKKCPQGVVKGIDYSPVSVEKSKKVNEAAIVEGRCAVLQGSVADMVFAGNWFDAVTAFETVYFWPDCALPGFVDSKNEEKTERNAGYLVVSHSGGGMLRQGTRKGIRRTPANRGMRAHWVVKGLDISEDVCHGMCP